MAKSSFLFCALSCFILSSGCTEDDANNPVLGNWKLTSWSITIPLDMNLDGIANTNLLMETECEVNEKLIFDKHGVVTSKDTYNPELKVSLIDDTTDIYKVEEMCSEGSIGFATEYIQIGAESISLNGKVGVVHQGKLTFVYNGAIPVYNENYTEIVDKKDLILIYDKSGS
ncbi:hypothetical protein BXY82_1730 [Gelidibacter sediminis]|uniref:Lipocalin-like protein n=2 Tax=Gelidibacter sediminis TaxID=1608710 RepID=A0A4R7PZY4_9FLAO|nr:hypothetical protein BXY82_1730 [Gelidibacter sediminis]